MGLLNYLSSILLPKQLVVTFNGKTYQILRTDPGFAPLQDAVKEKNLAKLEELLKQYGYIKAAVAEVAKEFNRLREEEAGPVQVSDQESDDDEDEDSDFVGDDDHDDGDESDGPVQVEESKPQRAPATRTEKFNTMDVSDDGMLVIGGIKFDNKISKKIADLFYQGYDIKGYYKLLKKIADNPEAAVKSGLLDFIAQNDLPITTDGNFLAYKVTRADGYDHHSGTVKYEVGKYVEMDREDVDDSRGVCSGAGLYFASIGYYSYHFGNDGRSARFLVEVDPADVVSIPTSYQNSKGRCCRMKVIKNIGWDAANVPDSGAIIDVSKWELVKPTEESVRKNQKSAQREVTVTGTQKLVTIPVSVTDNLKAYVERRHKEGVNPTLKNAQKAIKCPGTSVGVIAEAAQKLGYVIVEGDNAFSSSVIKPSSKAKSKSKSKK
jgi:hypothetical protein